MSHFMPPWLRTSEWNRRPSRVPDPSEAKGTEGSELIERAAAGEMPEVPIWVERRFAELGRDPNEWREG